MGAGDPIRVVSLVMDGLRTRGEEEKRRRGQKDKRTEGQRDNTIRISLTGNKILVISSWDQVQGVD